MNRWFVLAGAIALIVGAIHSWIGEKQVIAPLLRGGGPLGASSGSSGLKKVLLRVTWHLATLAMWGAAATLFFLAREPVTHTSTGVARIVSLTFAAFTLLVFVTPGLRPRYLFRHGGWAAFALIAGLIWWGTLR